MCFTASCAELALNKIVEFVIVAHKGQMYGSLPYTTHLFEVECGVLHKVHKVLVWDVRKC